MTSVDEKQVISDAQAGPREKKVACEVYSRIVGYLRPVADWNRGKQQEFSERKTYGVPQSERSDTSSN